MYVHMYCVLMYPPPHMTHVSSSSYDMQCSTHLMHAARQCPMFPRQCPTIPRFPLVRLYASVAATNSQTSNVNDFVSFTIVLEICTSVLVSLLRKSYEEEDTCMQRQKLLSQYPYYCPTIFTIILLSLLLS